MTVPIDIRELTARLNEAIALADAGEEVIVTNGAMPLARLVPLDRSASPAVRVPGLHPGAMTTSDDFDAPLPDAFWTGQT